MKIVTPEELDEYQRHIAIAGGKGLLGGLALALPASLLAQRRFAWYRALTPSLKTFAVVLIAVPSFAIAAERAGLRFEQDHWTGAGKVEIDLQAARAKSEWENMTLTEKIKDTAAKHEYGIIGGSWALAMAGSFGWIMRDKYQTFPQKLVQARMWAQGLTVGILIAAGAMAHANRTQMGGARHIPADHSWKDIIAQEERENRVRALKFNAPPPASS